MAERILLYISLMVVALVLSAQTTPKHNQVNPNQVRIGKNDTKPGTLVNSNNINNDRFVTLLKNLPQYYGVLVSNPTGGQIYYWPPDSDQNTKVICVYSPMRADYPNPTGKFYGSGAWVAGCYTQFGQQNLLTNYPGWAEWYSKQ